MRLYLHLFKKDVINFKRSQLNISKISSEGMQVKAELLSTEKRKLKMSRAIKVPCSKDFYNMVYMFKDFLRISR